MLMGATTNPSTATNGTATRLIGENASTVISTVKQ